jgi:diguanylate cyclase (GGDEF)-like protein/putative nucleotidyltransferase with HDIG domain
VAGLLLLCLYLVHLSAKCYLEKVQQLQVNEKRLEEVCLAAVESLALAIDARDSGTHSHIRRVQQIAVALGEQLELSPDELQAVRVASLTHDVGKLAVPDTILGKAGPLTPAEFERVKTHVEVGARILEPVQFPWPVIEIVRAHHERWDGQGYPEGLKGEAIPLGGRIVSLADMFDALTSPRPYRDPLSYDEAHAAVCAESGTRFDPRVVDAFTAIFPTLVAALKATDTGARRGLESCGRSEPAWGYVWDEIRGASREALSLAFTDPLTGLANARHLEAALHRAVHEARRDGGTLALLMIDLDGFKAINDGFGHLAGDAALQMVARVLSAELREGTTVCRYAGDEFVVLLSGCTRERAERVADRLRQRVSACLVPGTTCRVSLSVGLACFPEDATDVRALLAAADGQMYAEKSQRKPAAHSSVA